MATKKKLLQAAAGTAAAAGGGALSVENVFSTYLYEGNGDAQNIVNGINLGDNVGGSVHFDGTGDYLEVDDSSVLTLGTGDFTVECFFRPVVVNINSAIVDARPNSTTGDYLYLQPLNADFQVQGVSSGTLTATGALSANTWVHIAVVRSSGTTTLYIDGTSADSGSDTTNYISRTTPNIGKHNFSGADLNGRISNLRIVKGVAVYTSNFTPSTAPLEAVSGTALLTCTGDNFKDLSGNNHTVTAFGGANTDYLNPFASGTGEGGLVWVKSRSSADGNIWIDTERGANNYISSNSTAAQNNLTLVSSFNSNGFTVSGNSTAVNSNGNDYVSWAFRKAPKCFDCLQYTGNGTTNRDISHSLGGTVGMLVVKSISESGYWSVFHREMDASPASYHMLLPSTNGPASTTNWGSTMPTDSVFTVGGNLNDSGREYVAYLFAHNNGDGEFGPDGDQDIIKCGSYTTDGSGVANVDLGFEPQFVIIKRTSAGEGWIVADTMRGISTGGNENWLFANTNDAEASSEFLEVNSTGFKYSFSGNTNDTYIYIAIRRGPMAVPTDATDVFDVTTSVSASSKVTTSFPVDVALVTPRDGGRTYSNSLLPRLTNPNFLLTHATDAEQTDPNASVEFDYNDGFLAGSSAHFGVSSAAMWKRAPSFCDVVCYTGTGTTTNFNHNLGVVPEMIWVKARNNASGYWPVYHKDAGSGTKPGFLNTSDAWASANWWGTHTDSYFRITDGSGDINNASYNYIAYLFASLDGVSKVFSVTKSSGSDASVNCGFSAGPRFVLLKRTDSTGDWYVWDSERGIVAGNDPYLLLNSTAAEVTSTDYIDPTSNGFTIVNGGLADGDYIGYSVA